MSSTTYIRYELLRTFRQRRFVLLAFGFPLVLVGLVPFAALGVCLGHLLTTDAVGPAMGGTVALFSILGGTWFPVQNGALHDVATVLPSYWLVQAGHVALGGKGWTATGWLVIAAWTAALAAAATAAYRRDTGRT
jgi:ABC-2 type transport system permease protein